MTSRRVLSGVKSYLEGEDVDIDGLVVATVDESIDKTYPLAIVSENGTEEHEILRGVYEVSVLVTLYTDPERATDAEHATAVDEMYSALGNILRFQTSLSANAHLKCWDVRGVNQTTGPESGRRTTEFSLTITASEI